MTDQGSTAGPSSPEPAAAARMAGEDRHAFVTAFIEGVRPETGRGRSGRRTLVIGGVVAVGVAVAALVVGALAPTHPTPTAAAGAGAASTIPGAGQTPAGQPGAPTGGPGSNGGPPATGPGSAPGGSSPSAGPTSSSGAATLEQNQLAAATRPPSGPTYTGVAGPGCNGTPTATYSHAVGYYTDGSAGWLESNAGGYTGDGCNGTYDSLPMSGTAGIGNYDRTGYALYDWNFSGQFTHATCQLSVYVPNNTNQVYVGGDPTYYYFWSLNYIVGQSVTPTGDFGVPQVDDRGRWVPQNPFTVTTGHVTLRLVNSGIDYNSAGNPDYHHHAASAVRLTCTES